MLNKALWYTLVILILSMNAVQAQTDSNTVSALALSEDGNQLAIGYLDRTIEISDLNTNEIVQTVESPQYSWIDDETSTLNINDLAFNHAGDILAASFGGTSQRGLVWLIDVDSGQRLVEIESDANADQIAWSPDDSLIAVSGGSGAGILEAYFVRIYDVESTTLFHTIDIGSSGLAAVDWHPTSDQLALGVENHVYTMDTTSWEISAELVGHEGIVTNVAWSPTGHQLASTGDGTVRIWDPTTGIVDTVLQKDNLQPNIEEIAWSPDGNAIASSGLTTIYVWDTDTEQLLLTQDIEAGIYDLVWQTNEILFYASSTLTTIESLNITTSDDTP